MKNIIYSLLVVGSFASMYAGDEQLIGLAIFNGVADIAKVGEANVPHAREVLNQWAYVMQTTSPVASGAMQDSFIQAVKNSNPDAQQWCQECLGLYQKLAFQLEAKVNELEEAKSDEDVDNIIKDEKLGIELAKFQLKCAFPIVVAAAELQRTLEEADGSKLDENKKLVSAIIRYVLRSSASYAKGIEQQL